jgi:hypothetical protein
VTPEQHIEKLTHGVSALDLPPDANLRRDIDRLRADFTALSQLVEATLRLQALSDPDVRRYAAEHACVALYGPGVIAEAEAITAASTEDHVGRRIRELRRKASKRLDLTPH